jgi:uncharacterized membrane-anchored protein
MTHFIRVKYLTINDINPDDLLRGLENYVLLNYELISEISEPKMLHMAFSREEVKRYFTITMNNKTVYYCKETEFDKLFKHVSQ